MRYFAAFLVAVALILLPSCNESDEADDVLIPELKISAYLQINEDNPDGHAFEPLELGVPRLLAPTMGTNMNNLQLFLEFDGGTIQVVSDNSDVQISVDERAQPWDYDGFSGRIFGYDMHVNNSGYMALFPIGGKIGYVHFDDILYAMDNQKYIKGYTGREYIITVNACIPPDDDSPVITAQLRLIQLEDADMNDEMGSRFYSIELISYEMSETYAMELAS